MLCHRSSRSGFAGTAPAPLLGLAVLLVAALPGVCRAEDTDQMRLYGSFRFGVNSRLHLNPVPGVEVDRIQQSYGFSLGANLGPFFGVEVAADQAVTDLSSRGGNKIGEYGIFNLVPEARVRYPLLGGMLTPYLIGGVGVSKAQFKDRKPGGLGVSIHADDWSVVGAVGAGIEYFLANNIALGVEAKYLISRGHEIEIEGRSNKANLDSLIAGASLRLLFPESPSVQAGPPIYTTDGRFYIGIRYGGSLTTHTHIGGDLEAQPAFDSIGGKIDQLFGFALGWDVGRLFGVELTAGGFSPNLEISGLGPFAEYALYYGVPQLKVRYPLFQGRLVPYLMGGAGISYFEVKDVKPRGFNLDVHGSDVSPVGLFGGGIDYMVARNIALGFELEYLISRGNTVKVEGRSQKVNADALLMTAGVRVYFGKGSSDQ